MADPVLSVVDYVAWEKGYMPPSEHILIDKLSYRGAKVIMSFSVSRKEQVWIVLEGAPLTDKKRKFMLEIMKTWFDIDDSEIPTPEKSPRFSVLNDGENRWVLVDSQDDDPSPVFETEELARAEMQSRIEEAA